MKTMIEAVETLSVPDAEGTVTSFWRVTGTIVEDTRQPDGSVVEVARTHYWLFPQDTMEWRAAEYGIPLSDTDTLLDIVLAEPFIPLSEYAEGTSLHDSPSITEARREHLGRCARAKLRMRMATRADGLLNRIRGESPLHDEVVAIKADLVQARRSELRTHAAQITTASLSAAQRAELLRGRVPMASMGAV
jgi:hypothetical protein